MKQQSLFDKKTMRRYSRTTHGGLESKGHRKLERPFHSNKALHLVLKSAKAHGPLSFLAARNQMFIKELVYAKADRFGVKVGDFVNMGNHLHIKMKTATRLQFQKFLKSITSLIARHVTGARRGRKFGKFWQGLAFTRVLKSKFEELRLRGYFSANRTEKAAGREKRNAFLKEFNAWANVERLKALGKKPPPKNRSFEDGAPAWA